MTGEYAAFTLVLALAVGVLTQALSRHLRVPGIVLLLAAGAGLGPDGLGWVRPDALGYGLLPLVELSVAVILFEGGLNLEISRLRRAQTAIRRLVLYAALVTLAGGAVATHWLLGWDWMTACVFGSLVVVTGPTVIGPLIRELRLRTRVSSILEAEGVLIDPVGALLAVLLLEVAAAPDAGTLASSAQVLAGRVALGALAGAAAGYALVFLLRLRAAIPEGMENLVVLASVLFVFQGCNEVLSRSGLVAVTIAGVVVGNLRSPVDRDLREFKDQLTVLLIGLLFVLLAAAVRLDDVRDLGWPGLGVVAALVLVVRPLGVWLATLGTDLGLAERALLAWIAPRGIVAAAVASATALELDRAGVPGGAELLALVFLTIAVTVVLAGLTAGPVASLLGQRLPGREGVAILGVGEIALLFAGVLRKAGVPVQFLDANPAACARAEEAGYPVVFGNALTERTQLRARFDAVETVIGMTENPTLNGVFVSRVREGFRVPFGYVAVASAEQALASEGAKEPAASILFDGPHDIERWDVRARHASVELERWVWQGAAEATQPALHEGAAPGGTAAEEAGIVLAIERRARVMPMHEGFGLEPGDVATVAVYRPEGERLAARLRTAGFAPERGAEAA